MKYIVPQVIAYHQAALEEVHQKVGRDPFRLAQLQEGLGLMHLDYLFRRSKWQEGVVAENEEQLTLVRH